MPNYAPPDRDYQPIEKPTRGSGWAQHRENRKAINAAEEKVKDDVRRLDKNTCRWPKCENCRSYKPRLEAAHVIRAKGMGGDHGTVTTIHHLMLLDLLTHGEEEQHKREVRALTDEGTRGPCEFWRWTAKDGWFLVAREVEPFVYERD